MANLHKKIGIIVCCISLLTSCISLSYKLQAEANTIVTDGYPGAIAKDATLSHVPPLVNLSYYPNIHLRPHYRHDIAIALAASGGGYRAANLTLGVLMGLEDLYSPALRGNLLQQIDYFSSVSGGGFGIGYYLAQLYDYQLQNGESSSFSLNSTVSAMLRQTSGKENPLRTDLTPLLFFGKLRGVEFEANLNQYLLHTLDGGLTLGNIFSLHDGKLIMPYWVINTTIFQNAAMLPFTPDVLARYEVRGYYHQHHYRKITEEFDAPDYSMDMPVAVGLAASAAVPFALPPTTLISTGCTKPCYLQLYDGGLTDNLGIYSALDLLVQDKAKIKVLIIVDAHRSITQPFSQFAVSPQALPLIWRVLAMSTDSNWEHIKANLPFIAKSLLCQHGTRHVIVVDLNLDQYPEVQKINTSFNLSANDQLTLVHLGQTLVKNNQAIKQLLVGLKRGKMAQYRCDTNTPSSTY